MKKIERVFITAGIDDRLTLIKIRYALEIIKNEVIKLVILLVLFSLLGYQREFLIAMAILLPVRVFSGGMHMKSNITCFFYSLIFFLLALIVLPMIAIPLELMFFPLAVSAMMIAIISPVASYKRPIKTDARRASLKRKTFIILALDCVVLILLWRLTLDRYFVIGVWVVALQAIQLLATWIFRKVKGERNVNVEKNQKLAAAAVGSVGH